MDKCGQNIWSDNIESNNKMALGSITTMVSLLSRLIALGVIVFGSVTYLPAAKVTLRNRVIITVVVVTIYALLDVISNVLGGMRNWVCNVACPNSKDEPDFNLQSLDL